jgi:hypothetical protein
MQKDASGFLLYGFLFRDSVGLGFFFFVWEFIKNSCVGSVF